MNRRIAGALGGAILIAVLVGCSGAAVSTAPPASAAASPTVASTAATTPSPSVEPASASASTAAGVGKLCAKEHEVCPTPAGTYSSAPFEHPFTFTIDGDGWANDRAWPHGGSMTKGGSDSFLWASGITAGRVDEGDDLQVGPTQQDFIDLLRKSTRLTVTPTPVLVTVGGVSGLQVDVEATGDLPGLFFFPEDAFNLRAGEKVRFIVLDKDGATVVLMVESFKEATFDAFMTDVAQPILGGLTWE